MQDNTMKLNDGRTLGFSDYGKPGGIPILLFHGIPGSRIFGLENEPLIDKYGIRVIAPERSGYGLSDPKILFANYANAVKKNPANGEADTLMPIAPAKGLAKLIPGCETHFLPDAGHLLLESEEVASKIVARLLSVNA